MAPELRCLLLAATYEVPAMRTKDPFAGLLDRAERTEVPVAEKVA